MVLHINRLCIRGIELVLNTWSKKTSNGVGQQVDEHELRRLSY